jgi:hypothetical protein
MTTAVMNDVDAIEQAMEAGAKIAEKIASTFNFISPRGIRKDFCSDCCGSNGNSCQPQ